tara:strand:- start:660 stop:908 length:249 start_codon:yes stop_codon:yes gene_type:complete
MNKLTPMLLDRLWNDASAVISKNEKERSALLSFIIPKRSGTSFLHVALVSMSNVIIAELKPVVIVEMKIDTKWRVDFVGLLM